MKTETQAVIDGLADVVLMIKSDRWLGQWFHILARRSVAERTIAIYKASQRLALAGADALFLASLKLLADPRVFDAARLALGDCG
jgi:hypothetical protein